MKYHLGHKVKKDGKKYFIEPIFLSQEGIEDWKFEAEVIARIIAAPTLGDACEDAGIEPKSVMDCVALRKPELVEKPEVVMKELKFKIPFYDTRTPLVFMGKAGAGKTQFAKRHFKKPILISHLEDLRKIKHDTDGLVFDDMNFNHIPRQAQIHLLDIEEDRSIHVRYGLVEIPAGMPRIFCCNWDHFPFLVNDGAIERRHTLHEFDEDIRVLD
jgi:hypothetical protein